MSNVVQLACLCGKVKGQLKVLPKSCFHVHCLCCDCQKFASYLNNEKNILDEFGGSELFQTYPDAMSLTEGQDNISAVQLKQKGLYRWHTTCCNMPVANTMTSSNLPFVGISVKLMKFAGEHEKTKILGPVTLKAFGQYSIGEKPEDTHARFPLSYLPKIIIFMLKGMLKKNFKPSPFFNDKEPIAKVEVLP